MAVRRLVLREKPRRQIEEGAVYANRKDIAFIAKGAIKDSSGRRSRDKAMPAFDYGVGLTNASSKRST
jgi:hypothetical protein